MLVSEFDFDLPQDRIAQRPVEPRDAARLLRVTAAGLEDRIVRDLPSLLNPGDLLVFNDTRVIPARLIGMRGAAKISVTLHQSVGADTWRVFAKPAKRLRPGDRVVFGNAGSSSPSSPHPAAQGAAFCVTQLVAPCATRRGSTLGFPSSSRVDARNAYGHDEEKKSSDTFSAEVLERRPEGDVVLRFDRGGADLVQALETYGQMPLPPYIRGGVADARDRADYQTLFAAHEGAVAAPTAALHFTPELMAALAERGVKTAMLTLHVGAGTFLPVKVEDTDDHVMHEEIGVLNQATADAVNETHRTGGRVIAVGTTSLRLLESAADENGPNGKGIVHPFARPTSIFITPGYRFRAVDRLLTNFHLPRSTLMMLVAAFAGMDRIRAAYAHAVASGYRFYSYGDCCLLDPAEAA